MQEHAAVSDGRRINRSVAVPTQNASDVDERGPEDHHPGMDDRTITVAAKMSYI
jgi:hypothetical protein